MLRTAIGAKHGSCSPSAPPTAPPNAEPADSAPPLQEVPAPSPQHEATNRQREDVVHETLTHAQLNPIRAVWCSGELLNPYHGDFHKFISTRRLATQEGVIFRHLLRMILLSDEFAQLTPAGLLHDAWQARLHTWSDQLTQTCRTMDPRSTDATLTEIND